MDPFSHILLGYLLGFGLFGPSGMPYVVAAALAGALPDADIVFFPVSRWIPPLRHRGISHSVVGVTVVAVAGAWLAPPAIGWAFGPAFAAGSPLLFFVAMEVGGLSHVLLDAMDHWSVPIFAPFSKREYRFDADRIVNIGSMAFTVLAYTAMLYERGRTALWIWEDTTWVLLLLAVVYLAIRLAARWRAGLAARRLGFDRVIPQVSPLDFLFVNVDRADGSLGVRTVAYRLGRGPRAPPQSLEIPPAASPEGGVSTEAEALARSYGPAKAESWILGETLHFARTRRADHDFEIFWYSLEMNFWGRAAGVLAQVDPNTGAVKVRSMWRNPLRAFG